MRFVVVVVVVTVVIEGYPTPYISFSHYTIAMYVTGQEGTDARYTKYC